MSFPDLPARILYTWADLYSQQLQTGQGYAELKPTYSIWLLAEDLLHGDLNDVHRYRLRDEQGRCLLDHGGIWLLELNKFTVEQVMNEQQHWLKFFKDGASLDSSILPDWMQTDQMRQAMNTLQAFSEKEHAYHAYQSRLDFLRVQQRSMQQHLEQARIAEAQARANAEQARIAREEERVAKEAALEREQAARQETDAALAEIERLKALLLQEKPD